MTHTIIHHFLYKGKKNEYKLVLSQKMRGSDISGFGGWGERFGCRLGCQRNPKKTESGVEIASIHLLVVQNGNQFSEED